MMSHHETSLYCREDYKGLIFFDDFIFYIIYYWHMLVPPKAGITVEDAAVRNKDVY